MNRLATSSSPYLRQHADNPVDWHEWSDDAFAEARERDVPVLLSVGYAACHWCHVMAHESFEDEATAAQLNREFVSIKVDREERPDVDAVHMQALLALTGQGGWPMTVFLTPDGAPFHAGTYYPPTPVSGMPSFRQVLDAVTAAWRERRGALEDQSQAIVAHLRTTTEATDDDARSLTPADLAAAVEVLGRERDPRYGGFGGAPKFPPSMTLEHLLRHHARTGNASALTMARDTAHAMASGGMYDQLAGGFARYSVDATWTVPHFEKMLYDNAQLVGVYARLWRATGDAWARRVALETAAFLERDLLDGGFTSSLDADTEGVEGRFYVWTPAQLEEALGADDAAWAAQVCFVTEEGSFEHGSSVLRLDPSVVAVAPAPGEASADDDGARWARVRSRLREARAERTAPARDDKVVTAWNGLAIGSLAEAGRILGEPHLVDLAAEVARYVVGLHLVDGRLRRASLGGTLATAEGVLEDYALLADGLLSLFSATGDVTWFDTARALVDTALDTFVDGGRVFDAPADTAGPALFLRPADPGDNASPSGRSALAGALVRLGALTGELRYRTAADTALASYRTYAHRAPRFAGWALAVAEAQADGPVEVVVVGPADADVGTLATGDLARAAWSATTPGAVIAVGVEGSAIPALTDRPAHDGAPTAYVCRGTTCSLPISDAATLTAQLAGQR